MATFLDGSGQFFPDFRRFVVMASRKLGLEQLSPQPIIPPPFNPGHDLDIRHMDLLLELQKEVSSGAKSHGYRRRALHVPSPDAYGGRRPRAKRAELERRIADIDRSLGGILKRSRVAPGAPPCGTGWRNETDKKTLSAEVAAAEAAPEELVIDPDGAGPVSPIRSRSDVE